MPTESWPSQSHKGLDPQTQKDWASDFTVKTLLRSKIFEDGKKFPYLCDLIFGQRGQNGSKSPILPHLEGSEGLDP